MEVDNMINYTWQQANQLGFYFKTNGKRCIITKYNGTDKNILIPDTIDNKPVKAIGKNSFKGTSIESVVFPESILSIGDNAFMDCSCLKEVSHNKKDLSTIHFGKDIFVNTPYISKDEFVILNNVLLRFNNINKLRSVYIPFSVDIIATHAIFGFIVNLVLPYKKIKLCTEICSKRYSNGFNLFNILFYEIKDNKKHIVNGKNIPLILELINGKNFPLILENDALLNTRFLAKNIFYNVKNHRLYKLKFGNFMGNILECECNMNNFYIVKKFKIYFDDIERYSQEFYQLFDIEYCICNNWLIVFNLQRYDDYFKDKPTYQKILYSYYRIDLSYSRNEVKKYVNYITNPSILKETINIFITLDIVDFFESAYQYGWLNDKMLEYAISIAEKYSAIECYKYLKAKKQS